METKDQSNEPTSSERRRYRIVIFFLSALCLCLAWMYWQEKNRADKTVVVVEQVMVENNDVKADLLQLQKEYSTLETNDSAVQVQLNEKKEEISKLLKQAEKHKNDSYNISKLKTKIESSKSSSPQDTFPEILVTHALSSKARRYGWLNS